MLNCHPFVWVSSPGSQSIENRELRLAQSLGVVWSGRPFVDPDGFIHCTNGHKIRITISGSSRTVINGDVTSFSPGVIQLIPGGNVWSEIIEQPTTIMGLEISPDVFGAQPRHPELAALIEPLSTYIVDTNGAQSTLTGTPVAPCTVHDPAECHRFQNLFEEFIALARIPPPVQDQFEQAFFDVFAQFYLYLLRRGSDMQMHNATEQLVLAVKEWIDQHFTEPISIPELAAQACLNPSWFSVVFRRLAGVTPKEYLLRSRLHYAAELLASTRLPVTTILFEAGFNDQAHFNHAFKHAFYLSPREYRKNRQSQ